MNYLDKVWDECENKGKDFAFTVGKFFTDFRMARDDKNSRGCRI